MFRIKLLLAVVGCVLVFVGFQEFRVSSGTTTEPIAVALADIEQGNVPDNSHWNVGEHIAVYGGTVYAYKTSRSNPNEEPNHSTPLTYCFYPIISNEHSFIQGIDAVEEKYGDLDLVPDEEWPSFDTFSVLVKTKRFEKYGQIPDGMEPSPSVTGLLISRISSLDGEEENLVRQSFPAVDFDKLLILEDGRKPGSALKMFGLLGGGLVLVVVGVGWMFVGMGKG